MELVPIITQILMIVAAVFIIVLIVSYIASKVRKKEQPAAEQANYKYNSNNYISNQNSIGQSQFYNGIYYSGAPVNYPKEIKVVKRSSSSRRQNTGRQHPIVGHKTTPTYSNSRFTVVNQISPNGEEKIVTDEYGFKLYADNEISRSVYFPG